MADNCDHILSRWMVWGNLHHDSVPVPSSREMARCLPVDMDLVLGIEHMHC